MKKVILAIVALFTAFVLTACGSQDISGTWYYENNSDQVQLSLDVNGKDVTINYAYVDYKSEWFSVKAEEKNGKIASGEIISSNEIKINKVYELSNTEVQNPFGDVEKVTYKLSQDKETLTVTADDAETHFVKTNPKELDLTGR